MIRTFSIANFKAFSKRQDVPLAPLTLIFGANSAGKSSIIHGLALARHAVDEGELDVHRTGIGGESIDLGGFAQYVFRGEQERQTELSFALSVDELIHAAPALEGAKGLEVLASIGRQQTPTARSGPSDIRVQRIEVGTDAGPLLSMSARPDGRLRVDRLHVGNPVMTRVIESIVAVSTTARELTVGDYDGVNDALGEIVPALSATANGFLPRFIDVDIEPGAPGGFVAVSRAKRREDLDRAVRLFLPGLIATICDALSSEIETWLRRVQYLGPLRSYPPRHLAFFQEHDNNWYAGGGHAWDIVRSRADVRSQVNEWLAGERLKTPYELVVRDLLSAGELPGLLAPYLSNALGKFTESLAAQPDAADIVDQVARGELSSDLLEEAIANSTDVDSEVEAWMVDLARHRRSAVRDLVLLDRRTNTIVSHRDVGIGVSQVLPVLVSSFANSDRVIAIEQPELHLHPALQAELGDIFIEGALGGRNNTFILETHSEHLILRLLRRVRETSFGELEDDRLALRPEDLSILYVVPTAQGSEVVRLSVTPEGEFETPWPEGFFAERARELF